MTEDQFRRLALAIPGAVESEHMDHPDFRLGGKIFASLGSPAKDWAMVKLTPAGQKSLLQQAPGSFKPCSGAWGDRGYTHAHLGSADPKLLKAALQEAAANISSSASKKKPRR